MTKLVDQNGKPISQAAPSTTERVCLACQASLAYRATAPSFTDEEWAPQELSLVAGLLVGVQLTGSLLVAAGLPPEKSAHVQGISMSFCENHAIVCNLLSRVHEQPVREALENLRKASTFLVGRVGGKVQKAGP